MASSYDSFPSSVQFGVMMGAGAAKTGSLRMRLGGVADEEDDDELHVNLADNTPDLAEEDDFFSDEALTNEGALMAKAEAVDIVHCLHNYCTLLIPGWSNSV